MEKAVASVKRASALQLGQDALKLHRVGHVALDPDCIHLPSIYVKRLISGAPYDKKIEFRTVRAREVA